MNEKVEAARARVHEAAMAWGKMWRQRSGVPIADELRDAVEALEAAEAEVSPRYVVQGDGYLNSGIIDTREGALLNSAAVAALLNAAPPRVAKWTSEGSMVLLDGLHRLGVIFWNEPDNAKGNALAIKAARLLASALEHSDKGTP